jgi:DNA-binding NarL/FixJ family response regulator
MAAGDIGTTRQGDVSRPGPEPSSPVVLTDRHRQVLRLTAQGLRASEVAARLWLAESTVKQHLAEIRWRLQAPNTTRAVVIALIQGELLLADLAEDQHS